MVCYDVLVSCEALTSRQQNPPLCFETSLGCCVGCQVSSAILCLVSSLSRRLEETCWNVCTSPNSSPGTVSKGPKSYVGTVFVLSVTIGQYLISTRMYKVFQGYMPSSGSAGWQRRGWRQNSCFKETYNALCLVSQDWEILANLYSKVS